MGCWNETCMISGLPIRMGDPVVVYFLAPTPTFFHNIYNCCGLFSPVGFGINGIYDDYGSAEKIQDNDAATWTYKLFQHLLKMGNIELSEKTDKETSRLSEISHYVRAAERGWLTFSKKSELFTISLVFMHADLYKKILEEGGNRKRYRTGRTSYEMYTDKANSFAAKKRQIESMEKEIQAKLLSFKLSSRGFSRHFMDFSRNRAVSSFLLDNLTDQTEGLRDLMVEIMVFETCMNISRMAWRTTPGKGSQNVELAIPGIIADFVQSKIEHEIQTWKKEGDSNCDPLRETLFDFEGD